MASTTNLVPPRRLGILLRQARVAAGLELTDLIEDSGLSLVELDDVEHGRSDFDEVMLAALVRTYGIDGAGLVPTRSQLVIDLDEGRLSVDRTELDVDATFGPDAVLARYLALVHRLRDTPLGEGLRIRDLDVDVLGVALELGVDDVGSRLRRLMDDPADLALEQRRIRRQLLLPLVGVVVAATAIGTLVLVARPEPAAVPSTAAEAADVGVPRIATAATEIAPEVETDIGNGGAIEENAAG